MRKLLNILTACALICGLEISANAQQPLMSPKKDGVSIGNTKISRDDKDLVVDYQIMLGDNVLSCDVEVIMLVGRSSLMRSYVLKATELKGDFGRITESDSSRSDTTLKQKRKRLLARIFVLRLT